MKTKQLTRIISSVIAATAVALCLALAAVEAHAQETNPGVCPNGSKYFGKYYGEWAAEWVKWAFAPGMDKSPLLDETGENADVGQQGPMWFLAGNFGGVTVRTCTVPAGCALFLPIINNTWIGFPDDPPEDKVEENYRAAIAASTDSAVNLACEIDGVAVNNLQRYRVVSPVFSMRSKLMNDLGAEYKLFGPCATDGFYLMLRPLDVGEHVIHFHGENGDWSLDVTYNLTVEKGRGRHCGHGHHGDDDDN